jgi:uncharacterized lipoprotein YehR (DUF1307 family)
MVGWKHKMNKTLFLLAALICLLSIGGCKKEPEAKSLNATTSAAPQQPAP